RGPERSRSQEVRMPPVPASRGGAAALGRPLVGALFVSSAVLSLVSWYTTQQGMALYLSPWFSFLASLGVQSALVLVAWLVGVTEARRRLLVCVYAVIAAVSLSSAPSRAPPPPRSRSRPPAFTPGPRGERGRRRSRGPSTPS